MYVCVIVTSIFKKIMEKGNHDSATPWIKIKQTGVIPLNYWDAYIKEMNVWMINYIVTLH